MNKYQEALNEIKELDFPNGNYAHRYIEDMYKYEVDTLQELIDSNERNVESLKLKNLYIEMLEKALDKACEFIEDGNVLYECRKPIKEIFLEESEEIK